MVGVSDRAGAGSRGRPVLLQRFPDARAIATPKSVELMRKQSSRLPFFRKLWPGQLPAAIAFPEPYDDEVFTLEGHEVRIIEQGRTGEEQPPARRAHACSLPARSCPVTVDTTSLHVPSIDLVVGGDVFYNECHMYVAESTPESRANWIAALDRLTALSPKTAVAGHKKPGAPDTPAAIEASKRYLTDFGRLQETTSSDQELYDAMADLYPDWVSHQAWLMFGLSPANPSPASPPR